MSQRKKSCCCKKKEDDDGGGGGPDPCNNPSTIVVTLPATVPPSGQCFTATGHSGGCTLRFECQGNCCPEGTTKTVCVGDEEHAITVTRCGKCDLEGNEYIGRKLVGTFVTIDCCGNYFTGCHGNTVTHQHKVYLCVKVSVRGAVSIFFYVECDGLASTKCYFPACGGFLTYNQWAHLIGGPQCAVPEPPPQCALLSSKRFVEPGEKIRLTWQTVNALYTELDIGYGPYIVTPTLGGFVEIYVYGSRGDSITYTMYVHGFAGELEECSTTVYINRLKPPPPPPPPGGGTGAGNPPITSRLTQDGGGDTGLPSGSVQSTPILSFDARLHQDSTTSIVTLTKSTGGDGSVFGVYENATYKVIVT